MTKDLNNDEAKDKIRTLANDIRICMFCTGSEKFPFKTRPMGTALVDETGDFWFISSRQSHKNLELLEDNAVQLLYSGPGDLHFLSVYGTAEILLDRVKLKDIWNPLATAWFPAGINDPDISLIKVTPVEAYYWDTQYGKMVSLMKMAASAVAGRMMDMGVEGRLNTGNTL